MKVVMYHNPRCSKCQATLQLITEKGIQPQLVEYLENPPQREDLHKILELLRKEPQEIIRFNEDVAQEQGLSSGDSRNIDEWLEIMIKNPVLIERPIVVVEGKKAVIGRPPENVLAIL